MELADFIEKLKEIHEKHGNLKVITRLKWDRYMEVTNDFICIGKFEEDCKFFTPEDHFELAQEEDEDFKPVINALCV